MVYKQRSLQVYITCIVKVAVATTPTPISPEQKACSFSANGYVPPPPPPPQISVLMNCLNLSVCLASWVSADDSDQMCGCCDTTCSIRRGRDQPLKGLENKCVCIYIFIYFFSRLVCSSDLRWDRTSVGPINVKEYGYGRK